MQQVPLDRIVGSAGHSGEFDLNFKPRRRDETGRWSRVAAARQAGVSLPPVDLIKVGRAYLVMDGNHRVSVARARGQEAISAQVTELQADSLQGDESCQRLGFQLNKNDCPTRDSH